MSVSDNEAEKKFWRTPELVEGLLHFLDPPSIIELGQVHPLTAGIMQGISTWNRFIRKSCPFPPANHQTSHWDWGLGTEEKVAELRPILGVLQLIGSPLPHLLDLLEIICQRFPPTEVRRGVLFGEVKVTCPTHKVHNVSALGFVLLELVEGALGSSLQKIRSVFVNSIEGLLASALKSRTMRQEGMIKKVDAHFFVSKTQDDVEALTTLVQRTTRFTFHRLAIEGDIGELGWAALPEVLKLLPSWFLGGVVVDPRGFQAIVTKRSFMLEGRREDVRAVWDALPAGSHVFMKRVKTTADGPLTVKSFPKASEEDWVRFELYLDNENALVPQNETEAQN